MNVYKITNLLNGLIYIGQEKNYNPNYYGSGILIKEAISEFGIENFKKDIIEYYNGSDYRELNRIEIFWIKELDSRNPKIGYNLSGGGSLFMTSPEISKKISDSLKGKYVGEIAFRHGIKLTDEHKKRISEANKGKNKNITDETRKKMSESRMGIKFTDETKRKMSESKIGVNLRDEHRKKISDGLKGRSVSDESKDKLRISNINKKQKHSKSVDAIRIDGTEQLYFNNISQCARYFNTDRGKVRNNTIPEWNMTIN